MASSHVIVAALEDRVVKGVIIWDVDVALVGWDASFDLPVREAGVEGEGNILVHRLEGLEDEGAASRGRFNLVGESHINDVDKEGQRKESDSVIVFIRVGKEVRAAGEGIWTC